MQILIHFLSSGPISSQERRKKQVRVEQLKGKMLVMKHSDQNSPGDHSQMFFSETGKKFTEIFGDRSGFIMWGYDADKRMWVVKWKSGRIEYYEKKADFLSWTKATSTMVIKLKKNQFRIVDPKELLKFGERDICTLSNFQIIVENELFEAATKAFTGMVATVIDKKLWAGDFDQADVHLVEKH
uniref:Uncharacterized protein n=1 Tax=Lactuca sativa TaxID=4236 RepID=A0A9R1UC97_LACSA|nr:hypothetical protein LSAT_V11C900461930 [Lactuca sativa]